MKRTRIMLIVMVLICCFTACAGENAKTEQSQDLSIATPEPIEEPTQTAEPTPTPVPEDVLAFAANAQIYIQNTLSDEQSALRSLFSSQLLDTGSPELLDAFGYENYFDVNEGGQFVHTNAMSQYSIGLKLADPTIDWRDKSNYDLLANEFGLHLGIDYKKEKVTRTYSDGREETTTYRHSQGSEDSYYMSWIYIGNDYTNEGTARVTFVHPGQNEKFNRLVTDSFSMIDLPFTSKLSQYEQTYLASYSQNYMLEDSEPAGNVGISWWYVSAGDIQQLTDSLKSTATVIEDNDWFHCYKINLENDYFDYLTVEFYDYGNAEESSQPSYLVNCNIYYK